MVKTSELLEGTGTWKGTQKEQKVTEDGSWKLESRSGVDLA
jgi:hypothetical protein